MKKALIITVYFVVVVFLIAQLIKLIGLYTDNKTIEIVITGVFAGLMFGFLPTLYKKYFE